MEAKPRIPDAYEEYLHRRGLKNTRSRQAVLHLLSESGGVLTAEEMYQRLLEMGQSMNFSTVYRILELFTEKGLAEKTYLPDVRKYGFSLRAVGHRHRLICLACHKVVEIDGCPLEDFEARMAGQTQFDIVGHNLEWYGYCPHCRRRQTGQGKEEERRRE